MKKKIVTFIRVVLIIILLPVVILWLAFRLFKKKPQNSQIDVFNISQIDSLSGEEFENLLKTIFEKQGYSANLTKKSHDYGADLVLKKRGKITIVQAKCYEKNIGIKAIQEIVAAKKHYRADDMFVATNRYFSKDAIVLALEYNVKLIDRDVLVKLVKEFQPKIELAEKKLVASLPEEKQKLMAKYRYWI